MSAVENCAICRRVWGSPGMRQAMVMGLVQEFETLVVCDSCERERHEGRGFTLTEAGKLEVGP